jgi:uncharacterized protein
MEVKHFLHPSAFLEKAESWLTQREVENSLILGICKRMQRYPDRVKIQPYLAVVDSDGEVVLAAMMTPPYNLVLAGEPDERALRRLAEHLKEENWEPPGVMGLRTTSQKFSRIWAEVAGRQVRAGMNQRIFELTEVRPPEGVPGRMRAAETGDIPLAAEWITRFQEEAMQMQIKPEEAQEIAEQRIESSDLFFWEMDGPVSMAAKGRPSGNVISIGLVYTPPENRRRGYAGACVAALSQHLLDSGYPIVSLYTDLNNPTSNHIYTEIGFKPVCDIDEIRFD